jgi:hypothetical protein
LKPSGPLIPPATPTLPTGSGADLPPLTLPPESSAVSPLGPPVISKSSPLTGGVKVKLLPAAGRPAEGPTRRVGFFNHSDRDLELVIEGNAVKLPRKTYVHADVPPTFTWKHSETTPAATTVPAGAAGLDVVFAAE